MHQQLMGGGFGAPGSQFFAQAPGQSAQQTSSGIGQHAPQPGGFQQTLGGQLPLFHHQQNPMFSQASQLQNAGGSAGAQGGSTAGGQGQTGGVLHQV